MTLISAVRYGLASSVALAIVAAAGSGLSSDLPTKKSPPPPDPTAMVLPAVSAPNGKFDLGGGVFDSQGLVYGAGAFSVPLSQSFGFQTDAILGGAGGSAYGGAAGHLFWRDPSKGLIGLYGSATHYADDSAFNAAGNVVRLGPATFGRIAPEAELYFGRVSLEAQAGYQFSNANAGFDIHGRGFYSVEDVAYYATDDLRLSIGHRRTPAGDAAAAGFEYRLPLASTYAVSLFGEGRFGNNNYRSAWGGLRIYFGDGDKTLIRRHREDDPQIHLTDEAHAQTLKVPPSTPAPSPTPTGCGSTCD